MRDGLDDRRHHAERADAIVEAEAGQHGLDQRLDEAADEEGDRQPQHRAEHARDGQCNGVEHVGRGAGNRLDLEDLQRGDGGEDDDDRADRHADRAGDRAARRGDALGWRCLRCRPRPAASPSFEPGAARQPLEVERAKRGLDDMADDPPEDQPGEEDQAGAEQARNEGEHFVGHDVTGVITWLRPSGWSAAIRPTSHTSQ